MFANDSCRLKRPSKRAHLYRQRRMIKPASKQAAQFSCLLATKCSEAGILLALEPALAVPLRLSMTNKVDLSTRINRLHSILLSLHLWSNGRQYQEGLFKPGRI